jgi:Domain of unknown function (DUF1996)
MRGLVLAIPIMLVPAMASASPGWVVKCPYSHSNQDDPIKFPGQPGASHLHDFFGSTTTSYLSVYSTMVGSPTTCGTEEDKSGYWVPALYKSGVKINPAGSWNGRSTRQQFYYRNDNYSSRTKVEPFPPNFKMVQGYHMATSVDDANAHGAKWGSEMYWGCSDNKPDGKFTAPVDCTTGIITLHIGFPSCWDGVTVDGDAIASGHVTFTSGGACPAGFDHPLPRLIERLEYPVGTSSSDITLSSGAPYTAHADFWNTWELPKLAALVTGCLNAKKDCGTNP